MRGIDNPPVAWRYCGDQCKLWRGLAGVSREQLAAESHYTLETVRSMETGRRQPTRQLLEAADYLCGAKGLLVAALRFLGPEPVKPQVPEYVAAEAEAIAMHVFELVLIPGLLQTEEYMRELMEARIPPHPEGKIESSVAYRKQRQERLLDPTPVFNFVIYEPALRTLLGGRGLMKRQLQHLLDVGERRNVFIQVLPAAQGYFPGITGSFTLLETPESQHYVYVECQGTAQLDSDGTRASTTAKRFSMLRMQALNEEESRKFIRGIMEEL
ncbi:helix-turn-helix domain-containing protein [Streptomyces sp. UNOC14_S4]|nr:helix-turn-helix domain-containing protein [Streptomyces sp. UNOC14_S4]